MINLALLCFSSTTFCVTLLVGAIPSSVLATTKKIPSSAHSLLRHLQENDDTIPACNTKITTLGIDEVQSFAEILLQSSLGLAGAEDLQDTLAAQLITPFVKYGLTVYKVCGTCNNVWKHWDNYDYGDDSSFESYCGPNVHGSEATHSSLVFAPNEGNSEILSGNIPSFLHMHSFVTDLADCPTEKWPSSLNETLQSVIAENTFVDFLSNFFDYFSGVLIASSGVVSVFPDYIGYGESIDFSRSSIPESYAQAAVVSYAATGLYLEQKSGGCSRLANVGSMLGLSEGGFSVIPAATALQDFVDIQHVASGAGPLNTFAQMVSVRSFK